LPRIRIVSAVVRPVMARSFRLWSVTFFLCIGPFLQAQFGPPEPQGSGPKLDAPTVFPEPGTYPTTESITLLNSDPQATIHYTWDGSMPTSKSPVYDPLQVLFMGGVYDGDHGLKAGYTLRAVAMHEGHTNSAVANFQFVVDRRDRDVYVSEEILPGVRMIRDSDNDKMFLVKGEKKYALIDSGQGRGKLRDYISQYTGGLPIEPIFTHSHGDHIGQADQFIADSVERIGAGDRPATERLLKSRGIADDVIAKNLLSVHDGDRVDLGDRSLIIYDAHGHTPGSLVVFDEKTGNLFTGDSFGSNSATIPDALWLQFTQIPLDTYLATVKTTRENFRGKVTHIMTGHNDRPLMGEKYLDNLQSALQSLMDKGEAVLVPSYRPTGLLQVTIGDRMHDPDWVAINVNKEHYLPAPVEKIAGLTFLSIDGVALQPAFSPDVKSYSATVPKQSSTASFKVEPTSSRCSSLTVNGQPAKSGQPNVIRLRGKSTAVTIHVASADGSQTADYDVTVMKP